MTSKAYLAGGCFWCLEAVFQRVKGVEKVTSGYAGGTGANPSYEDVSSGESGYAETVELEFDTDVVTHKQLLEIFFTIHDPTTINRQGNDVGPQYRSAIFFISEEQKKEAQEFIENLAKSGEYENPIVTEVRMLATFLPAGRFDQDFYNTNQQLPYCQLIISPKIKKFERKFQQLLK